jgi:hypothetical protein
VNIARQFKILVDRLKEFSPDATCENIRRLGDISKQLDFHHRGLKMKEDDALL